MIKKKKKKNRIILCLCSIFVLVASIFSFIPLVKESKQVYADTVTQDYSFSGSNISSKTTFNSGLFSQNIIDLSINETTLHSMTYYADSSKLFFNGSYSDASRNLFAPFALKSGTYTFCLSYLSGTISRFSSIIFIAYVSNTWTTLFELPYVSSSNSQVYKTFTLNEDYSDIRFGLYQNLNNTFTDVVFNYQLVKGSNPSFNYQPYQDSTYLNYEFDFNSQKNSSFGAHMLFGQFIINNNDDYRMVLNYDYTTLTSGDNTFWMNPTSTSSTINTLYEYTFSKYNSETQILDNNYIFKLYSLFDNRQYENGYYFESHISHIILGSYLDADTYFIDNYSSNVSDFIFNSKYNFATYVDVHGIRLTFFIPLNSLISYDYFDYRTYYLSTDAVVSDSYNNGYNSGYRDGYNIGEKNGTDSGYKDGYKIGNTEGYNKGYQVGIEDSNQYSFLNLISSVIDAPMTYFQSLFNFELLGVNLQGFLMALFTLCVVVTIVRLCLGK